MVHYANLLNLVDILCICEAHKMWANREFFAIQYLRPLLRNVHPRSIFTIKIYDIETFEPVILQLRMFWRQSHTLDLESQTIQFSIS